MVVAFPQVAPPAGLKQSILHAILPSDIAVVPAATPPDSFMRGLQNWLPWALAACFAVLCVLLIGLGHSFRKQAAEYARELDEKREQYAELQRLNEALQTQISQSSTNYTRQVEICAVNWCRKRKNLRRSKDRWLKRSASSMNGPPNSSNRSGR